MLKRRMRTGLAALAALTVLGVSAEQCRAYSPAQPQTAQSASAKQIGTIKDISGNSITLTTDSGSSIHVEVQSDTKIAQVEPGQTNLKQATAMQLQDLQV